MAIHSRNILSLCAGVGGLELGISLALNHIGATSRLICAVEREAAAAASLVASMEAGWFHPAPIWSDMLTFDARPWRGTVHILASGDPCQENSVAGKHAGSDGVRFLAPEVVRIASECRPDRIFRENVPGNADGQLAAIVPALERLGYRVAAGIFSSSETGNTMRRERLFIMAERADLGHKRGGYARRRRDGLADGGDHLAGTRCNQSGPGCGDAGKVRGLSESQCEPEHGSALSGRGRSGMDGAAGIGCATRRAKSAGQRGESGAPFAVSTMARTPSERPGEARHDHERPEERTGGAGGELARTGNAGSQGQQRGQHHAPGRQVKGGHAGLRSRTILPPAVIPGPTDSRWRDVLDRWPELQPALSKEEAESHVRRGIDAMANRVERLRATGNGVDPVVAAYAYLSLDALLAA